MQQRKPIGEVAIIFKSLLPQTQENRAALRTAFATLAALLISFFFHFDRPYWSVMTVILLSNVYTGTIVDRALLRIIGAAIGAWLGYFLAGLVVNSLMLYLLAIFLLVFIGIYYYSFSSHAYAFLLCTLSAFIILAELPFSTEQTFYYAMWRPIEIGLGVLISAVSAWCIFPNNIQDNLIKNTNQLFDSMRVILQELAKQTVADEPDFQKLNADILQMKKTISKSLAMFGIVRRELGNKQVKIDKYRALFDQFYSFCRLLTYFLSSFDGQLDREKHAGLIKSLADFFITAEQDLLLLKKEFFAVEATKTVMQTANSLAAIQQMISSNEKAISAGTAKRYLQLSPLLQHIRTMIMNLSNILINNPGAARHQVQLMTDQQQLRNDLDNIISAIKTALAVVLAFGFLLASNWTGLIDDGIVSSVIISIKKNLYEMKNISIHRFLGCLLGGIVVLSALFYFALDLYDYVLLLFFSIWIFSYFSFKYPAYGYIGLQANMAIVIAMSQAGGPPVDLEPTVARLGGIIIGIAASYLVGNILWRTDFFSLLSGQLGKLFRLLSHNMSQLLQTKNQGKPLFDLTSSFWLCRGFLEAFPPEHFKQAKQERLKDYKSGFIQMTLIQATISHIYEGINRDNASATAKRYGVNVHQLEHEVLALYNAKQEEASKEAKQKLVESLAKIDLSVAYRLDPSDELANCIAYINALSQLSRVYPGVARFI